MFEYLIGVDGGGTGTRVRLARPDGSEIGSGGSGPSALINGVAPAWTAIEQAIAEAFANAAMPPAPRAKTALGLGLAGVHNKEWARQFLAADPGYGALALETDAYTTVLGAHGGQAGAIVALGTGSVGEALLANGERRQVGGWGFPAGDEGGGAWIGLRAIGHAQQALDGRQPMTPLASSVIAFCGGDIDTMFAWLAGATQSRFAQLAPLVIKHAGDDDARAILRAAGQEAAKIAAALDPAGALPLALCGGLGAALAPYLPAALRERSTPPGGDAAAGALWMIRASLQRRT